MSCVRTQHLWRCDGCGKEAWLGHGEWAEPATPRHWRQALGFVFHACSARCVERVDKAEGNGRQFIWLGAEVKRWPNMKRRAGANGAA